MQQKHEFEQTDSALAALWNPGRTVYVRPVSTAELPAEVREQVPGLKQLFGVYAASGERLALVKDRNMAFVLARQNDLAPVTVH